MDSLYLNGSEEVLRASNMSSASADMMRAASIISESVQCFTEQVNRLEGLLEVTTNLLPQRD